MNPSWHAGFWDKPLALEDGTRLFVTVHPSALLRLEDEADQLKAYRQFVADL